MLPVLLSPRDFIGALLYLCPSQAGMGPQVSVGFEDLLLLLVSPLCLRKVLGV